MTSAEEQFFSLVNKKDKDDNIVVSEAEVEKIFNALKPIKRSFLIGEWNGGSFDTGHPVHKSLKRIGWAGKDFRSDDDVDPIMVLDDAGKRVYNDQWGHASLREMVFRGVASAAMIYDTRPIFDYFRYVNEDTVLGAMDCPKVMSADGTYYFFLTRRK